jgi:hypothetical protein
MRTRCLPGSGFVIGGSRFWFIDKYVIFGVNVVGVFFKTRIAVVRVRRILELAVFSRCVDGRRVGRAPICYFTALQSISYHNLVLVIGRTNLIGLSSGNVDFSLGGNI